MLGIVREEPSCQLSPPKDAIYLSIYQKGRDQYKSRQRFGMTPRRGGGKARRIPTTPPPAAAAPKSRPRKGGAAPGRPPTSSPARPPQGQKPNACLGKPLTPERNAAANPAAPAAMRSPGATLRSWCHWKGGWRRERAGNVPNSGTEPPSHAARLRGKEREKENRQLRRGLVGGTTATLQYGDTDGAGVDETRGNGGRRRYGGVEERTEEGEWGRRRFNGGANN